jgi:hypothetical protein
MLRNLAGVIATFTATALDINIKSSDIALSSLDSTEEAYGAAAVTNVYSAIPLTRAAVPDANSAVVPDRCLMASVALAISAVVTAVSVDVYLAEDALGRFAVSHPVNVTFQAGMGGNIVAVLEINGEFRRSAAGVADILYLIIKTNAGTLDVVARLRFVP